MKNKLIKSLLILAAIIVFIAGLSSLVNGNSMSLSEYAALQSKEPAADGAATPAPTSLPISSPEATYQPTASPDVFPEATATPSPEVTAPPSTLVGASLNGTSQLKERTEHAEGFYYETISDNLRRYMTGISYPAAEGENAVANPGITFDELRYVHILHYDFEGNPTEGELICNEYIAQDLVEIFYELYRNEYQLERVRLIDEYEGDDVASMTDNNTSCFNYRVVAGSSSLSKHALGLAIDINPLYNPYITYAKDGTENISPVAAAAYADRSTAFPYKIDENDLCYKLFTEHGFIWGGNWNSVKDYQHFQKPKP